MMKKFMYWLPRVLAILFIVFVSMFALDVFGEPQWLLALVMHLIPSFVLIALTVFAWKRSFLGGILFLIAGLFAFVFFGSESYFIYIPTFVIGGLFLLTKDIQK